MAGDVVEPEGESQEPADNDWWRDDVLEIIAGMPDEADAGKRLRLFRDEVHRRVQNGSRYLATLNAPPSPASSAYDAANPGSQCDGVDRFGRWYLVVNFAGTPPGHEVEADPKDTAANNDDPNWQDDVRNALQRLPDDSDPIKRLVDLRRQLNPLNRSKQLLHTFNSKPEPGTFAYDDKDRKGHRSDYDRFGRWFVAILYWR